MKIVMLDAGTLGADLDLSPVTSLGEVDVYPSSAPDVVVSRLAGADVAVLNKIKMTRAVLEALPDLKLICVTATGYDNIDLDCCRERGITLCNVPAYSTDSVAQVTVAMALSLATHLPAYRAHVHEGAYSASGVANHLTPVYHELSSMTWGVVGGGNIGGKVASIAAAIGCRVLVTRRRTDPVYQTVDIDTLVRESDIISLHLPLSEETRGMIDAARIAAMKKGAILINVARGAVTDEEALASAIENGHLGGLGIDVFTVEPFDKAHPFTRILERENVLLTPHMAWGSFEARTRCLATVAENITRFFAGNAQNKIV